MSRVTRIILLILFLAIGASAPAAELPQVEIPDWLDVVPVADKMEVNGLPARVYRVSGNGEPEKVLGFYRKKWRRLKGQEDKEVYVAPWHILNRLDQPWLYTVQVRASNPFTVQGYVMVSDMRGLAKADPGKSYRNIPALSGSRIANAHQSEDPGQKGRVAVLTNSQSVAANRAFYDHYYTQRGFTATVNRQSGDAVMQVFTGRDQEAHIVIARDQGQTQVVINMVEY